MDRFSDFNFGIASSLKRERTGVARAASSCNVLTIIMFSSFFFFLPPLPRLPPMFDVLIVKIGTGKSLALKKRKNPKKLTSQVTLYALDRVGERRGRGAKTPYQIVIKFCTGVRVPTSLPMPNLVAIGLGFGDN